MGFTLGLPPGIYVPDKPEIRELVEKLRAQNGIIMPSAIQSREETPQRKKVMITNLPLDISPEKIADLVKKELLKRKLITDTEPIVNVEIHKSRINAFIELKSQKDAEAAVQLGKSIIYDGRELRICWPMLSRIQKENIESFNEQVTDFDKDNTMNALIIDSERPLPSAESIKEFIEKFYPVENIIKPAGFNHAVVNLVDPSCADIAVFKLDRSIVDCVTLRFRRAFIQENEGPRRLEQSELTRVEVCEGPSPFLSVVSPYMRKGVTVADILNPEVPVSVVIQPETEELQPPIGRTLLLYNIAPQLVLFDPELCQELITDIRDECNRFGYVDDCIIETLKSEQLPSDYAVVRVTFSSLEEAKLAQIKLSGRRFDGRIVITQIAQ